MKFEYPISFEEYREIEKLSSIKLDFKLIHELNWNFRLEQMIQEIGNIINIRNIF